MPIMYIYDWPLESAQTYWFGTYSSDDQQIPTVVPAVDENQTMMKYINMKSPYKMGQLILLPQSQSEPSGSVCKQCTVRNLQKIMHDGD